MFGSAEKFCYLGIMIEENGLENTKKKELKRTISAVEEEGNKVALMVMG